MTKRYGLKAINDEASECQVCNKTNLKRVMWIVELDTDGNAIGDVFNCGTTCGAKMLKITTSQVNTKVNNFQTQVSRKRDWLAQNHPASVKADELIAKMNEQGLNFAQRKSTPEYAQMKAYQKEARDWAAAQEIIIEL